MKLKSSVVISGSASAIAVGLCCLSSVSAIAQPISVPTPESSKSSEISVGNTIRLNTQQQKALSTISEFAFDQLESIISSGLDPTKLKRPDAARAETLRQQFSTFLRLDNQQKAGLRTILQTARDQMKRQMEQK
ncbi:hypothetical protein AB3R30_05485 [Leptolyngbyaceae cyanobacterium UHCC 1019]